MKAADIKVGAVYRMRFRPHVRLCNARVVDRMDAGRFVVEPIEVERDAEWDHTVSLAFRSNQFEREVA